MKPVGFYSLDNVMRGWWFDTGGLEAVTKGYMLLLRVSRYRKPITEATVKFDPVMPLSCEFLCHIRHREINMHDIIGKFNFSICGFI